MKHILAIACCALAVSYKQIGKKEGLEVFSTFLLLLSTILLDSETGYNRKKSHVRAG